MPTLHWIGKDAIVNHHKEVPFRLLKCNEKLSVGDDSGNLLVQGDNLEALKALLPYYAGQGKVGGEAKDLSRHDKWLYQNLPHWHGWLGTLGSSQFRQSAAVSSHQYPAGA